MLGRIWGWLAGGSSAGRADPGAWASAPMAQELVPPPPSRAFDRALLPPPGGVAAALAAVRAEGAQPRLVIVADLDVPGSVKASLVTFADGARRGQGVFDFDLDAEMPFLRLALLGGPDGGDRA